MSSGNKFPFMMCAWLTMLFQEQMELGVVTGYCLIDGMIDHQTEGGGGHWEEGTVIKRGGEED